MYVVICSRAEVGNYSGLKPCCLGAGRRYVLMDGRNQCLQGNHHLMVNVIDLPLLRVAVEGSNNPISLEKPCQASLPPDQQGHHSLGINDVY